MKPSAPPAHETPSQRHQRIRTQGHRESAESIVVAIILALLFRAFVAEAFVIPTGSMAPALMGAHKDVNCPECGFPFQAGASIEQKSFPQSSTVVAAVCPNCRLANEFDLPGNANHATFSGDRILVSKFVYALADPRRWDVIVFKYPGNPKQNYIKRLVGLPNETLRIRHGDVFARPAGESQFSILRKPHDKVLAMSHSVHDTAYQPASLVKAQMPDPWQPWEEGSTAPPTDSWQVIREQGGWSAQLPSGQQQMRLLRYFHRWLDTPQWERAQRGESLAELDPYSSRTITDYYAYDSFVDISSREVYRRPPGVLPPQAGMVDRLLSRVRTPPGEFQRSFVERDEAGLWGFVRSSASEESFSNHWVGDLMVEADLESDGDRGTIVLELVESAVIFRCNIDVASGQATLSITDIEGPVSFASAGGSATEPPTAATKIRGGQRHRVRFANCDDALYLWVDGKAIEFDQAPEFDMGVLRTAEEHRPYKTAAHPLDAAPVAIGAKECGVTIHQLSIARDKYYIATKTAASGQIDDYDRRLLSAAAMSSLPQILSDPANWDDFTGWQARKTIEFTLEEDQFFPMGDNSPESMDARCWVDRSGRSSSRNVDPDAYLWADANYVPRDLLVGKALMVFWPHTWNRPIPLTPNLKRIGFIR